jgi:hypothetical protein
VAGVEATGERPPGDNGSVSPTSMLFAGDCSRFLASARWSLLQLWPPSATEPPFGVARDFAAWVGVVPRQYSTGGK